MKSILLCLLLLVLVDVSQAQDRIALLRDTTRLGISPHALQQRYPQALNRVTERPGSMTLAQKKFTARTSSS